MLTAANLLNILQELQSPGSVGCYFDFKDRFDVSLRVLEVLKLVKVIKRKIPACNDHCENYNDCEWIALFQKRKSTSKYKLTEQGIELAEVLSSNTSDPVNQLSIIRDAILVAEVPDIIISMVLTKEGKGLEIAELVTSLLKETSLNLQTVRSTIRDILDLLISIGAIKIEEGVIFAPNLNNN